MRLFTSGWLQFLQAKKRQPKRTKKGRGYAPLVEMLEDRRLLSITFDQVPAPQENFDGALIAIGNNVQAIAEDSISGQTITYSATGLPPGLSIDPSTGFITGTIDFAADLSSPYSVVVTANDAASGSVDAPLFTWSIDADPITFTNPGTLSNFDGAAINLDASASNTQGNALTYSATGLPDGLSIDPTTGLISGQIGATADATSPYGVTVTATDALANASNAESFEWDVSPSPITFTNPGTQTNFRGATVSLDLSATSFPLDTLSYIATGLPDGLTIDTSTGLVTGQISDTADTATPFTVTVTASDTTVNSSKSETFQWNVDTSPVSLTNPGGQTNIDSDNVSLQLSATDSLNNTLSYSAVGLPANLSIDSNSGLISGQIDAAADTSSPYSVTVTATDATANAANSQTFTWFVLPTPTIEFSQVPGTQTNFDGATISSLNSVQVLATDTGATGQTISYAATGLPPGLSIDSSTGIITGPISFTADTGSPYTVTITATDSFSTPAKTTFEWDVNPSPITFANPGTQTNFDGATVNLPLGVNNSQGNALTFTATGLPSGLTIDPNTGAISGQISTSADTASPYSVLVTATDTIANARNTETFEWDVNTPPITVTNPGAQTNNDGATVSLQISATDSASNPLTYSATNLPPGLTIDSASGKISGKISDTAHTGSPYSVTVTATDPTANAASSQTFSWTVKTSVITLTKPADQESTGLQKIRLKVTATDSANHKLTYAATGLPSGLTINSKTGVIAGVIAEDANAASPYTVTVTVTDATANTSQSTTFKWTVTPGAINGTVFFDANGNGIFDRFDPHLAGVKVTLTGTTADNVAISVTVVTNAKGNFSFIHPPAGTYTVTVQTPSALFNAKASIGHVVSSPTVNVTDGSPAIARAGRGGLRPTFVSLRQFLTSTSILNHPYGRPGTGIAFVTHAPTVKTPISTVSLSSTTTTSTVDLAGHFTDADLTNSTVTMNITNGLTNFKITGVTNTIDPTITLATAANLAVGETVTIAGVVGATGVNGTFTVASVLSSTSFTITSATAPGDYTSGGTVTPSFSISDVTNTVNPTITTTLAHNLQVGDIVTISGVQGATGVNGTFTVASVPSSTTFTITDATAPGGYTSGGAVSTDVVAKLNLTLFDASAPQTVANFFDYIKSGAYDSSIFSRLVSGFVLQGGGAAINSTGTSITSIAIGPKVPNEFGASNTTGTIAMAQSAGDPNSATDQFFFNLVNNNASGATNLDAQKFTVFGKLDSASLATLASLATTPTFNASASAAATGNSTVDLNNLPLTGYTNGTGGATSAAFPADATASNYMVINNVAIDKQTDFLTYKVTSSDPTIVTAALDPTHNEQLTLTKGTNTGTAKVTVTATDSNGLSVTSTITVVVTS